MLGERGKLMPFRSLSEKPLILIHQRADKRKTIIRENYQTDHMDHSLVNETMSHAI